MNTRALILSHKSEEKEFRRTPVYQLPYRRIETISDIFYTDVNGFTWFVPAGYVSDGYSIPRFFWRVAGSPFDAVSVIPCLVHDRYCDPDNRVMSHEAVHGVFNEIMKVAGERKGKRKIYYRAVKTFGPKWSKNEIVRPGQRIHEHYTGV